MVLWFDGLLNEWDQAMDGYAKVSFTIFVPDIFGASIRGAGGCGVESIWGWDQYAPRVPHLRGGSRPLAGQTHPNNAQGLD
jgi:hypothetical protein